MAQTCSHSEHCPCGEGSSLNPPNYPVAAGRLLMSEPTAP